MSTCGYRDEEMLQLSGIQHYVFCPRQWALIHLEQLWDDTYLTAEGSLLHANVDNPFTRETNGSGLLTLRGIRLVSSRLGLSGIADAVEIYPFEDAPKVKSSLLKSKKYDLIPVEYKRGRRKANDCDCLQVVAQAMILEEMLGVMIKRGAIFYWEERHREYFDINDDMRDKVEKAVSDMHKIMSESSLPLAHKCSSCKSCSLIDRCLPALSGKSASKYINDTLKESNEEAS